MITKLILFLIVVLGLVSCEDKEEKAIYKAQKCLDSLTPDPTEAEAYACYSSVEKYTTQKAYVVRCAAKLIQAGLTDEKIKNAFSYFNSGVKNAANSQAQLMLMLNLRSLTLANEAVVDCKKSEITGNLYIATVAATGTAIGAIAGIDYNSIINNPGGFDPSQIDSRLSQCVLENNCNEEVKTTLESSIGTIADTYCVGRTDDFCKKVDQAESSSNVYESMLCAVQGKQYVDGHCQ